MSSVLLRHTGPDRGDGRPRLHLTLFGPLQGLVDGTPLELGPPKQQALLAVLLLRPGLTSGPELLTGALWGDEPPAYAKNLLQKYVSGLRAAFTAFPAADTGEPGRVPTDMPRILWTSGGYRLLTGDAFVDLQEYERLAAAGTASALTGNLHEAARYLDDARILVTGPLAEGIEAPALARERVYRDERFLADMELRTEIELDLGRHRNAVPYLYFLLHRHPLSERLVWLLMLALFRAERGAEALRLYRDYRHRTTTELGTEPGRALQDLQRRVLDQDPCLMTLRTLSPSGPVQRTAKDRSRSRAPAESECNR
ncbi:AfsR/SARP family transcriptional regulator [Streptomyces sp. NK15101]|uniref:AfsR/SARP family transcriptional regulator n=1 Tax=Streptomyces sp. NK15101 TaxID=2873261 RepID=UPI001CECF348|nr:AfsR/SARP family transcriptional regulator [Streptomyces sp. NK15101]